MSRLALRITGSSGSGLVVSGLIVIDALKSLGFFVNADREYPSLIKGGHAGFRIETDIHPVHSLSSLADVVVAVDRVGLMEYLDVVKPGGIMIHDDDRHEGIHGLDEKAKRRGISMNYIPARKLAHELGGDMRVQNMITIGLLWRALGLPIDAVLKAAEKRFRDKPKLLEIDLKCLEAGYHFRGASPVPSLALHVPKNKKDFIAIDGNDAIGIGAIHAGVRAYYAYPMSPSSSILTYLAKTAHETGMLVKQAEDEITVVQMALGSMYAGTRALCATSGGGYDLMTETVSLSGMIECPLVVVICQRPGPATGLPTWTGQGDLNLAIFSAHGEFPRIVIGVSDPESCFFSIQHALNLAEKYQVPVLVLSEKTVCETVRTIEPFPQKTIPIERGLVTDKKRLTTLVPKDRFRFTESGVSERWIPGSSPAHYYGNSDEHREDGTLTEDADEAEKMMNKRLQKLETIAKTLPEPEIFGKKTEADISFIGWGSTKNVMIDVISSSKKEGISVNYLHYEYLYPLKTKVTEQFFASNKNVSLLEGNAFGQLGMLIEQKTGKEFTKKFLKYNGRQFFFDEVMDFVRLSKKKHE